jgi:selenide,water dikinase
LFELLEGVSSGKIGMDCSVVPLRKPGLFMISTTDFFYPSVDDPFYQGQIGCANVLSDLYSFGVPDCDNMLMIMGVSRDMGEQERMIVSKEMIRGFNTLAAQAKTEVTGGQTVLNPWPIIGGVAMSVVSENEFILPVNAKVGDVIVLTKPLGTQLAVNAHQWLKTNPTRWDSLKAIGITEEDTISLYHHAMLSMSRLNRIAASLMKRYNAHAATDITGFGIVGHANNLASNQIEALDIEIHTFPTIKNIEKIASVAPGFKFMDGFSAETSGGLFICMSAEDAPKFIEEIQRLDGCPAWIVAECVPRQGEKNAARLRSPIKIVEIDAP